MIRVRGSALKPERQFAQVGTELIGVDSAEADAEAVLLAVDALRAIGVVGPDGRPQPADAGGRRRRPA